ncbi:hypothetical protein [Peptoniphilus timonensis]|uniref:hypothetical protein n=1 Tax=Peptoniphilus timonensis TaxID=1268254 RepID=UPI0002E8D4CB|nr:hypothetical protein [Peptoniphilus timonensis]
MGNVNSIVKNIKIENDKVEFVGGRKEDFSNKKTPRIQIDYGTFLELLDIYSNEVENDKKLFEFINTIYNEIINSKESLYENLFIITSRKIFSVLGNDLSFFSEKLVKREIEVNRNLIKKKMQFLYMNNLSNFLKPSILH